MRYLTLCTDYDGTLATQGTVFPETIAAVEQLIASGRKAIMVTGREGKSSASSGLERTGVIAAGASALKNTLRVSMVVLHNVVAGPWRASTPLTNVGTGPGEREPEYYASVPRYFASRSAGRR